jgi:hypothetical protein
VPILHSRGQREVLAERDQDIFGEVVQTGAFRAQPNDYSPRTGRVKSEQVLDQYRSGARVAGKKRNFPVRVSVVAACSVAARDGIATPKVG